MLYAVLIESYFDHFSFSSKIKITRVNISIKPSLINVLKIRYFILRKNLAIYNNIWFEK